MLRRAVSMLLLLLCLSVTEGIFSARAAEERGIKIIVTNDVHGSVYGDDAAKRIGYAKLRGYLDALEKDGWTTFLMDAGDAFSGNAVAQFDAGKSVAALMGKAGYRLLNPGNHAFDYNMPERNDLYYQDVLLPAVRANAAGPVDAVSVNVRYRGETPPGMRREPLVLFEEGGGDDALRIVVAGVTTPYAGSMSHQRGMRDYDFGLVRNAEGAPDHAATKANILRLVAEAAAPYDRPGDIVILLSHIGCDDSADYAHGEITGRDAALVPNIDFVADAHSHNLIETERVGDAYYGIAGRYLTHFAEITITREGGAVRASMKTKSCDQLAGIAPSEAILAETRAVADRLGMGDRVFELGTEVDLSDAGIAEVSTPLGRFICREMLAVTGADFALFNAGGIRAGLAPGWVTVGQVYDVIPFQNNLQTFRLSGAEIYDLFDPMPAATSNAFPQFFGLSAYACPAGENSYKVVGLLDAGGHPVDPDGEYVFATINFLAEGGDGYSFPADELENDFGDFFSRFAEQLRKDGGGDLDALNENNSLLLFDTREEAAAAWLEAAGIAEGEEEEILFADVAENFRKHCVRVFIHGKTHDGEGPSVGTFDDDIRNERPTPVGGYWWDERHVVIHDPVLHDDFIRSIEIAPAGGLPGSGALYPARVAGRFTRLDAMLLEVLPAADGSLPESHPLAFVDGALDEAHTLGYGWTAGKWRLSLDSALGASSIADDGEETAALGEQGVFVNADGEPLGLSFGDAIVITDDAAVSDMSYIAADDAAVARDRLRAQLAEAVLETTFRLRITVDDDDDDDSSLKLADDLIADGSSEVRAAGLVVGQRSLLVPVALPHEGIARIDAVTVRMPGGRVIPARFLGAFRNYMALFIETDEDLPADNLPEGFALLNPLQRPDAAGAAAPEPAGELIQRWRIDYALGRRRETADYDRWVGTFRGYRGDTVVETRTNETDGALAFDTEGRLVALSLTPRLIRGEENSLVTVSCGFRPVDFLSRQLRGDRAFDPSMQPVDEGRGERLIDLGVEFQPLDANTARLFHAARATRAGEIGLLVTHVYPGTIANDIGLQEHDVLVRFFVEGRGEPVELRSGDQYFGGGEYEPDMTTEAFQNLIRFMPPPWPSRDNAVSALLTGLGAGRKVEVEYLREGETRRAGFITDFFEPDYRSARRERFDNLGLTARPVTYEVARFFNRPKGGGVIVSRVEEGGKAAVAGLHHYLIITHVDGREVEGLDDFAARVENFEAGNAPVELTVDSFGKTRLVKIE